MKTILTSLTIIFAATNAFAQVAAIDETQKSSDARTDARVQTQAAEESVDLAALFEKMNRAAKENDFDAMFAIVEESRRNDATPDEIKIELAETLCVAQINDLGRRGDLEGLKKYCDKLLDSATQTATCAGVARRCVELVEIYAPKLGYEFQRKLNNALANEKDLRIRNAGNYYEPSDKDYAPHFDVALFDFESGRDLDYYRNRYAQFEEAVTAYQEELNAGRYGGNVSSQELIRRGGGTRIKLLREIILADNENDPNFTKVFENYASRLRLWNPSITPRREMPEGLDAEFIAKAIEELRAKNFESPAIKYKIYEIERNYFFQTTKLRFTEALNSSEADRQAFLDFFNEQLHAYPGFADSEYFVRTALDSDQRDFAAAILHAVEKFQQEDPNDAGRTAALINLRRVFEHSPKIEELVGKRFELAGVDANFNEVSLEALRGKYVVVLLVPSYARFSRSPEVELQALAKFVENTDPEKIAVLEYDETLGSIHVSETPDLRVEKIRKALEDLRAKPWPVLIQDLSIRSNVILDEQYPALFRDYRLSEGKFALVDPNGVLISLDPEFWRVQRRLELIEKQNKAQ